MMATETQRITLAAGWTRITSAKGREAVALLDAYGSVQVAVAEGDVPDASLTRGHAISGAFSVRLKGTEILWGRGAGVSVAITQLAPLDGYGTASATQSSASVDETARAVANAAQSIALDQQPWVAAIAPDTLNQRSIISRQNWSPKYWTGADVTTTVQRGLADHAYPVSSTDGAGFGVTLAPGQYLMSKKMVRKSARSDVLLRLQVNTTGPGTVQLRLRNFENDGTGNAIDTDTCAIPGSGRQTVFCLVSAAQLAFRTWIRPGFLNTHATMTAVLEDFDMVEIDDYLPIGWFNPPIAPADAQPAVQEAVRISGRMTDPRIDFQFLDMAMFRPVENTTYASIWRNGLFQMRGVREDWAGGVMDNDAVPRQKGVIRLMNDFQQYERIRITNPVGYQAVQVVTANSVYTEGRCLANGFEDAYKSGTVVSTFSQFWNCGVDEFDDYGMRYTATGSGFTAERCNIRKRLPGSGVNTYDADYDRGYCLIVNAGDGCIRDSNLFGGEYQVYQQTSGTFEFRGCHPWKPPRVYYRRYFGPAGLAIRTGIQIRQASQIGTYDNTRVTVTRDPANWEVVVTPIATIAQADAAEVQIRADEVCAFLKGYGSHWFGTYFDGGTVRMTRGDMHKFSDSCYGLIGAMSGINPVSLFEWQPNNVSAVPSINLDTVERNFGKRGIFYPRLAGDYTPVVPRKAFEGWGGEYRPDPKQFATTGTEREVAGFSAMATMASVSLQHSSNTANERKVEILTGDGAPEGVVTAIKGAIYLRTGGSGAGTTLYAKTSGTGNTGWVALSV